jgi:hypothetical protein
MEKLKYKRIDDDEPYEDGDNFDDHIGFQNITNPYELLDKQMDQFSIGSDSDSNDSDAESDPEESKITN